MSDLHLLVYLIVNLSNTFNQTIEIRLPELSLNEICTSGSFGGSYRGPSRRLTHFRSSCD
jgi:hypothetical protein